MIAFDIYNSICLWGGVGDYQRFYIQYIYIQTVIYHREKHDTYLAKLPGLCEC